MAEVEQGREAQGMQDRDRESRHVEVPVVTTPLNGVRRAPKRWPDPGRPTGAVLYAVAGGLIVWLLVDVLPHLHVSITWH